MEIIHRGILNDDKTLFLYFTDSTPSEFYIFRLFTYIPGETFSAIPMHPKSLYNIGKVLGKFHDAMKVSSKDINFYMSVHIF